MMSSSVSLKFFIDSDNNQASTNIQFRHNGRGSGGGVELMRIQDDGRVGIGNSSPSDLLEVGTGGAVCNGTTWMDGSSREYKKNIEELSADDIGTLYSILDQVKPVRFQYKQDPKDTPLRYGMIAEEMPDALASTDRKHLELGRHVGFLMAVVKDMNQQKEVMQEEIDELKHEIAALKERISGSQSD
jgi:hypothetical protein